METVIVSRSSEFKVVDPKTGVAFSTTILPHGSILFVKSGDKVKKNTSVCKWDPYNSAIISEAEGKVQFEHIEEGLTYREELDEQTGFREIVITETKDKKKNPAIQVVDKKGEILKTYSLPVGAHISVKEGDKSTLGQILCKIPRVAGKSGDITGGSTRVTELFEARNPSNPAVVSEVDGIVSYGKIKRGNRRGNCRVKNWETSISIWFHFLSTSLFRIMTSFVRVRFLMELLLLRIFLISKGQLLYKSTS